MSPTVTSDRVTADVDVTAGIAPGDNDRSGDGDCALCSLPRSEHGVRLIHRFIRPGRAIVTL